MTREEFIQKHCGTFDNKGEWRVFFKDEKLADLDSVIKSSPPSAEGAEEILREIFEMEISFIIEGVGKAEEISLISDLGRAVVKSVANKYAALTVDKMYPKEFVEHLWDHVLIKMLPLRKLGYAKNVDEYFKLWKENQR